MAHVASECDPEPELPACFRDRGYVEKVIGAIGGTGPMGPPAPEVREPAVLPIPAAARSRRAAGHAGAVGAHLRGHDRPGRSIRADGRRRGPTTELRRGRRPGVPGGRLGLDLGLHRRCFPTFVAIVRLPPRPGPPLRGGPGRGRRHRGAVGVVRGLGGGLLEEGASIR